jgi:hypothetical protein
MRAVVTVLLAVLVAAAAYLVLIRGEAGPDDGESVVPGQQDWEREQNPALFQKTGTLVVRVRAPDGSVPPGAEVGYVQDGERRLALADAVGKATFSDAPVGRLQVVARAPGFQEASQTRELMAGIQLEVLLFVTPRR